MRAVAAVAIERRNKRRHVTATWEQHVARDIDVARRAVYVERDHRSSSSVKARAQYALDYTASVAVNLLDDGIGRYFRISDERRSMIDDRIE